jgi:hypothetical protein
MSGSVNETARRSLVVPLVCFFQVMPLSVVRRMPPLSYRRSGIRVNERSGAKMARRAA